MKFLNTLLCILIVGLWVIPAPVDANDPIADFLFPWLKPPVDSKLHIGNHSYVVGDEVVEKNTENSKVVYLGTNSDGQSKFSLDISMGVIHYKDNYYDTDEQWKNIDTAIVNGRIDKAPYIAEFDYANKSVTVTDKKTGSITTLGYQSVGGEDMAGVGSAVENGNTVSWDNVATDTDLKIVADNTKISFQRILKSPNADTSASFSVSQVGDGIKLISKASDHVQKNIPLVTSVSSGGGLSKFSMNMATKSVNLSSGSSDLVNGILTEDVDVDNVGAVTYPLIIDPVIDVRVGGSTEDGEMLYNNSVLEGMPVGWSFSPASVVQFVGGEASNYGIIWDWKAGGGMRFQNITIPKSSTITTASFNLTCSTTYSMTTVNSRITGDDEDNAATFSTLANYQDRRGTVVGGANNNYITTANVTWDNLPTWNAGTVYQSPEIKTVVQEIVNRAGWSSGNAMVIFWDDHEGRSTMPTGDSQYYKRSAYSYDGDAAKAPLLHLEYIDATTLPTVTTKSASSITSTGSTFNGNITSVSATMEGFAWGNSSYSTPAIGTVPPASYTSNYTAQGSFGAGTFSYGASGLSSGYIYYDRAYVGNATGYGWGSTEDSFLTLPNPPTFFVATANDSAAELSWTKATVQGGVNLYTTIKYSAAGYPASITDGTLSYNGTASSYHQGGLTNGTPYYFSAWSYIWSGNFTQTSSTPVQCWTTPIVLPFVSTLSSSSVTDTTASVTGNITDLKGGGNCTIRGIAWGTHTGYPYDTPVYDSGSYGIGSYTKSLTGLPTGTTIYFRAYTTNAGGGTGWGSEMSFLTKPAAPIGITASDGASTTEVTVSWTKSTGATDYHVWRDGVDLGSAGDVAIFHDTGANPPIITGGAASASDGAYSSYVYLTASESVANGTTHTYKVVASNATGNSSDSTTDTGYRGTSSLTYAWQRTSTDNVAGVYSATGNTTDTAMDFGAPVDGSGRWYRAIIGMTGASSANTTNDRGYRAGPPTVNTTGVTGLGNTWAIGGGSLAAGLLAATQVGVDYGLTSIYGFSYVDSGTYSSGAFSVYTSGLSAGTMYHYRAKALVEGIWYYGGDSVFYTLGAATPFVSWGVGGGSDSSGIGSANITYQTFTTNTTTIPYSVTKINLMVKRVGLPGIVTASIRATTLPSTTTMLGTTITTSNATGFAWGVTANATLPLLQVPPASYSTSRTVYSTNLAAGAFTYANPLLPSQLYYYRGYSNNVTNWFWSGETALYGTPAYPVGEDIASGTLDGTTFGLGYSWYTFTMGTEVCLAPNTVYAIVLKCEDADASNYVLWQAQAVGEYTGGNSGYSMDSGTTWVHSLPKDQLFEVWGNPCFTLSDAKVFSSYINTGDWLITCLYKNLYPPYYAQAKDVSSLFVIQLYNPSTATVIAQTKCFEWGYKPGTIYLSPASTTHLQWGYPYRVRLYGLFTGNPYTEYVLQPTDYLGSDLTRLDAWVRSCASLMETYYNTSLTTYLTDRGVVLNSAGGVIFATDIPQLSVRRPNLFSIVSATTTPTTGEYDQKYQDTLRWKVLLGPQLVRTFTAAGNTLGVSGATIGSWLGFMIYALVALFCFRPGHAIAAMVVPVPILLIAFGTGLAELALMGILIAVAIVIFVWQVWFKGA